MNAQFAVSLLALTLAIASVCFAVATWRHSKLVMTKHSTTSVRVELDEMRDAIGKHTDLLRRINQRGVMQERRAANGAGGSGAESSPASELSHKDRLRLKAGLRAGEPVKHS
jgi:hypothetical protein